MKTRVDQYQESLRNLPASGGGGAHVALLGAANLGALAKMDPAQVFADLRGAVHGSRPVPDSEIRDAVSKAFTTRTAWPPRPRPAIRGADALRSIIRCGDDADEADLWDRSPIRIDWPADQDGWRVLSMLYTPDEFLFIGDEHTPGVIGRSIRTAAKWIDYLQGIGGYPLDCPFSKIIPNPLTGMVGSTKDGKGSFRADACIASFRFLVAEFDGITLKDQYAFWMGCPHLPVAAIIHSGKKSLHAWVRVDAADAVEWTAQVEQRLFAKFLKPLGLDVSCKNEARLSRMPGHVRKDTGRRQKLLYLAPAGRAVNP